MSADAAAPGAGGLVALLVATFGAAALGALASVDAASFYGALVRPGWAPPPWVFGPVWTVLYALMCTAAWWVVRRTGWRAAAAPLALYAVQLVLNALWTWLFFRWHAGAWALADVLGLLGMVAWTAVRFGRVRAASGWLLAPYLAWVGFATTLTWALWHLNPGVL